MKIENVELNDRKGRNLEDTDGKSENIDGEPCIVDVKSLQPDKKWFIGGFNTKSSILERKSPVDREEVEIDVESMSVDENPILTDVKSVRVEKIWSSDNKNDRAIKQASLIKAKSLKTPKLNRDGKSSSQTAKHKRKKKMTFTIKHKRSNGDVYYVKYDTPHKCEIPLKYSDTPHEYSDIPHKYSDTLHKYRTYPPLFQTSERLSWTRTEPARIGPIRPPSRGFPPLTPEPFTPPLPPPAFSGAHNRNFITSLQRYQANFNPATQRRNGNQIPGGKMLVPNIETYNSQLNNAYPDANTDHFQNSPNYTEYQMANNNYQPHYHNFNSSPHYSWPSPNTRTEQMQPGYHHPDQLTHPVSNEMPVTSGGPEQQEDYSAYSFAANQRTDHKNKLNQENSQQTGFVDLLVRPNTAIMRGDSCRSSSGSRDSLDTISTGGMSRDEEVRFSILI